MLIRPAHTADGQLPHPLQRQKANCLRCGNKRSLHIPLHQGEAIAKFRRPQTAKSLILGGLRKMVVEKPCKNGKIAYLSRLQGRLNPQKSPNCQGISIFLVGEAGKAGFSWSRPKTVCLCFVAAGTNYSTSGHELSCQLPRTIVSAGTNVNQRLIHPYASCDGLTANGIFGYTSYNISLRKRILDGLYTYTSSRQHQEAVGGNT